MEIAKGISKYIILLFLAVSCNEQADGPGSLSPYDLWKSYNIHHYTIEQTRSCYCIHGGERMKVTVHSDTIWSVMRLSDSTIIQQPYAKDYLPIDSLFGIIQSSKKDSLVIIYNSEYGYPEFLDINPQFHALDGGVLYETYRLVPKR